MVGFGIDLAGYTTGKTSLAVVEIEGQAAKATLLRDSALSFRRNSGDNLSVVLRDEVMVVRRCLTIGSVAVDIPIDLQNLSNANHAEYVWQLTLRPIDRAVRAMPPLADRIGAPVARFAAIMREGGFMPLLGKTVFEAYPAGTLKILKINAGQYKGEKGVEALVSLCRTLKINPHVENDDDIDAIICAVTAAAPAEAVYDAKALSVRGALPKGFRIPKSLTFRQIATSEAPFETWMAAREGIA